LHGPSPHQSCCDLGLTASLQLEYVLLHNLHEAAAIVQAAAAAAAQPVTTVTSYRRLISTA